MGSLAHLYKILTPIFLCQIACVFHKIIDNYYIVLSVFILSVCLSEFHYVGQCTRTRASLIIELNYLFIYFLLLFIRILID